MYSLKQKLQKSLIMNMIVVMLLLLAGLNITIRHLLEEQISTRLQHDADSLISLLQKNDGENLTINPLHLSTVYNRVRSGHYYLIRTDEKTIRSRSLFDFDFSLPGVTPGESSSYQMRGAGDENWLVWQQLVVKNNKTYQIWIAEDITSLNQSLFRFSLVAVVIVLLITLVSIYRQQRILNLGFSVFDVLRRDIKSIRTDQSDNTDNALPIEVKPLVDEIRKLMRQLSQRIQRTRKSISNLSHQIKTPLQILSLQLSADENSQSAQKAVEDIHAIVDRELRRARISGSHLSGSALTLQSEIPYLIEIMQKIYPAVDIECDIPQDMQPLELDRDDMLELLGNLLDNACKFSIHKVALAATVRTAFFHLEIEDDGPGVNSDQFSHIIEQGVRLDESVKGHGLGLSICSDIVTGYRGTIAFTSSRFGGLKVIVDMPLERAN